MSGARDAMPPPSPVAGETGDTRRRLARGCWFLSWTSLASFSQSRRAPRDMSCCGTMRPELIQGQGCPGRQVSASACGTVYVRRAPTIRVRASGGDEDSNKKASQSSTVAPGSPPFRSKSTATPRAGVPSSNRKIMGSAVQSVCASTAALL